MMAKHLGIDFSWILIDFGGQVGAKLGSKIDHKSIKKLMPFGVDFSRILASLGLQNGAKLALESHQKSIPTSKGDFLKKHGFLKKNHDFEGSGGRSWK